MRSSRPASGTKDASPAERKRKAGLRTPGDRRVRATAAQEKVPNSSKAPPTTRCSPCICCSLFFCQALGVAEWRFSARAALASTLADRAFASVYSLFDVRAPQLPGKRATLTAETGMMV